MKDKASAIGRLVGIFLLFLAVNAFAANQRRGDNNTGTQIQQQVQQQVQTSNQNEEKKIQTQAREQTRNQEQIQQTEQINAEQYRNRANNFVQNLLKIAERKDGVGQQIRTIAQEQNQSEDKTIQAMKKIQTRSRIKTFLMGSDYKNLGILRSELIQTRNRLEQLKRLMANVENEGDKTELQNQVKTLEQEQEKIENFIRDQEGKFSLFGWLVKWLGGYGY